VPKTRHVRGRTKQPQVLFDFAQGRLSTTLSAIKLREDSLRRTAFLLINCLEAFYMLVWCLKNSWNQSQRATADLSTPFGQKTGQTALKMTACF